MPVYANVITTGSCNATCQESSCERMSNLAHQLPSSPYRFSHGSAVENGLALISRSHQISFSTHRWSRTVMNGQWFPLQGHPDASKHPPHACDACPCAFARTTSVCLCFPSDMEVPFCLQAKWNITIMTDKGEERWMSAPSPLLWRVAQRLWGTSFQKCNDAVIEQEACVASRSFWSFCRILSIWNILKVVFNSVGY